MKRKTNLFYIDGPDSKFLTFSNYTESLTGNFLSTDTKLFPDKFLCLKLNNLNSNTNSNTKSAFIKYLAAYYENKLAALRDNCITNDINQEHEMLPLAYLIEAILNVCTVDNGEFKLDTDKLTNPVQMTFDEYKSATKRLIRYIGDVTEQDYNGTYTDIICNINANEYYEGEIIINELKSPSERNYTFTESENTNILHGWENEQMFEEYNGVTPIYDDQNSHTYLYNTYLSYIKYVYQPEKDSSTSNDIYNPIEFNIIIPLFSVTNINYNVNTSILESEFKNNLNNENERVILLTSNNVESANLKARVDVPLGIWIYGDEEKDTFIELKHDNELNLYPSWSLLIASQFKPFPYSLKYIKENDVTKSIMHAFPTFAEVLSKVNNTLNQFTAINNNITALNNKLTSLEKQLKDIGISSTIVGLEKKYLKLNNDVYDQINEFKKQLYGYVDNITWSSKYRNNN